MVHPPVVMTPPISLTAAPTRWRTGSYGGLRPLHRFTSFGSRRIQVCDVLQGVVVSVGGAGQGGEAAQREAVEPGERQASIGRPGDGCVDIDADVVGG